VLLLIPLGPKTEVPRLPRVTVGLMGLCLLVFLFTGSAGLAKVSEEEARLERIAEWTLTAPVREVPELRAARERQPSALAFLAHETVWQERVPEPDRSRLVQCLDDYRRLIASHPFYRFGLVPSRVTALSMLTHLFLHADFLHLLFNMVFLWAVGGLLEAAWGPVLLALLYVLSGAAAALTHVALNLASMTPAIGASGAVAGLMGAFAVAHAKEPMRVAFVMALAVAPRVRVYSLPAVLFLGFWFIEQLFWWVATAGVSVEIAFGAHVGGFAFGALAGTLLRAGVLGRDSWIESQ
jgi:membrane associated rhomboid family serine protease